MLSDQADGTHVKRRVVSLLNKFARQIQAMDDAELERVLAGDWRIELKAKRSPKKHNSSRQCSMDVIRKLRDDLNGTESRQTARRLIDGVAHTRGDLTRLAKMLDLPVPKSCSTAELKDRLIESTVGFRLRSAAVRGEGPIVMGQAGGSKGTKGGRSRSIGRDAHVIEAEGGS